MTSLIEFLEARLSEDEQAAGNATPGPWDTDMYDFAGDEYWRIHTSLRADRPVTEVGGGGYEGGGIHDEDDARYIAHYNPARALRDAVAKRNVLERHGPDNGALNAGYIVFGCRGCGSQGFGYGYRTPDWQQCPELLAAASAYADHPDYDESWRL